MSLWRNRGFLLFWAGQTLSVLGGSISLLALPLLVLESTGSIVHMGMITALVGVVTVVTGLVAGHVVDTVDRMSILVWCDWARAGLHLLIPVVWLFGEPLWVLYVAAGVGAALTMLFQVAYITAVAGLVAPDQLTEANGKLQSGFAVAAIAGPVMAGVLAGIVGPAWAIGIDGLTYIASAVSLLFIRLPPMDSAAVGGIKAGFLVGFRFLWGHRMLRALTVLLTALTFVTMGARDLLVFRLGGELSRGTSTVGAVMGVAMVGSIGAGLVAAAARRRLGFGACWLASAALIGGSIAAFGLSDDLGVVAAGATGLMFGLTLAGICSMSLRQELTPAPLLGRVTSAFWTVHYASGPLGAAALTVAAGRFGVGSVALVAVGLCAVIVAAGAVSPLGRG
ncbi:major facilitator superfamily MFS_1 [Alloactinosynnema sp. L-07]|nr:major facilitator superfamily MFS_1 [Alloactinosynnema sp. L-07]